MRTPGSIPCVWAQSLTQWAVSAAARGAAPARGTFGKAATSWRGRVWAPHIPGLLGPRGTRAARWSCWDLGLQAGALGGPPSSPPPLFWPSAPSLEWPRPGPLLLQSEGRHPDRGRPELALSARLPRDPLWNRGPGGGVPGGLSLPHSAPKSCPGAHLPLARRPPPTQPGSDLLRTGS